MTAQDLISAVTVLFIIGMIWLRTRMQYSREARGGLELQPAGRLYFAAAAATLVLGWLVAPWVGQLAWPARPAALANSMLMRVIWFLATYYIFIAVHRFLKVRGLQVYKPHQPPL
jgi:hypothetical protein